jgi:hypothetical protein
VWSVLNIKFSGIQYMECSQFLKGSTGRLTVEGQQCGGDNKVSSARADSRQTQVWGVVVQVLFKVSSIGRLLVLPANQVGYFPNVVVRTCGWNRWRFKPVVLPVQIKWGAQSIYWIKKLSPQFEANCQVVFDFINTISRRGESFGFHSI